MVVRWWNVRNETPSGLKLNRVWHVRQLLFALLPPTAALLVFYSLNQWDQKYQHSQALHELQRKATDEQKRVAAPKLANAAAPPTIQALLSRIEALETRNAGAVGGAQVGTEPNTQLPQSDHEPPKLVRESSMQQRRRAATVDPEAPKD